MGLPAQAMRADEDDGYNSIIPRLDAIPEELRALRQWVLWRYEERDGKLTKVPYQANRPRIQAKADDPQTWSTYSAAVAGYRAGRANGIGLVFSKGDPYAGIDLDKCRNPETGEIEAWAQAIIDLFGSYTEISVSGTGVHILIVGTVPPGRNRKGKLEMYSSGRYFTMTGDVLGPLQPIQGRQQQLDGLHAETFGKAEPVAPTPRPTATLALDDQALINKAKGSKKGDEFTRLWDGDITGYPSQSEADLALCSMLYFWTGGDPARADALFRQSSLMRRKWDEVHGAMTYGQMTIARVVERGGDVYTPKDTKEIATNREKNVVDRDDLRQHSSTVKNSNIATNKEKAVPNGTDLRQSPVPQIKKWGTTERPAPAKWHVDKLFQDDAENLLAGEPGVGKTWIMADLAVSSATGTPFLGRKTRQGPVLIVNFDDSESLPRIWAERACRARGYDFDDLPIYYWQPNPEEAYPAAGVATPEVRDFLRFEVERIKPRLILIDAYSSAFPTLDGNKNQDVVQAFEILRQIRIAAGGACVVLIDHTPKKTLTDSKRRGVSGSQQKHARTRTVHLVSKLEPAEAAGDVLEWEVFKANAAPYQAPFGIERHVDALLDTATLTPRDLPERERAPKESQAADAALVIIQSYGGSPIMQQDLIDQVRKVTNVQERTIRKALVEEVREHASVIVSDVPGRGNPKAYRWHGSVPDDLRQDDLRQIPDLRQTPLPQINPDQDALTAFKEMWQDTFDEELDEGEL